MNKVCAVVFLYEGQILPDYASEKISNYLQTIEVATSSVTVVIKDSESIADAILAHDKIAKIQVKTPASENEQIIAAVAYVGNSMKEEILIGKKNHNYAPLVLKLISEMGNNDVLRKSVEILATASGIIPADVAKKYNMTEKVLDTIKSVYYSLPMAHGTFRQKWQVKTAADSHHKNAIPYSRKTKHKSMGWSEENYKLNN